MIARAQESTCDFEKPLPQDPSPEEIARRASAIRRGWTDAQRMRRRVTADEQWLPPSIIATDLAVNLPTVPEN